MYFHPTQAVMNALIDAAKRGVKIKNIKLTEDPDEVECRIDGSVIVLKTVFLKKA